MSISNIKLSGQKLNNVSTSWQILSGIRNNISLRILSSKLWKALTESGKLQPLKEGGMARVSFHKSELFLTSTKSQINTINRFRCPPFTIL